MATPDPKSKARRDLIEVSDVSSALPADLVRVLGWLQGHLSEPINLEQLAQIGGVRSRTLEMHFKMFLCTTPLGWVRRMRLARARQQLLHSGPAVTVTEVAVASGYSQLGRFAGQYRKAFGELPSTTVQRTKNSMMPGADPEFDDALRLTLSALPFALAVASKQCDTALEKLERPQELVPNYGLPKAIAGWCWGLRAAHGFSSAPDVDRERAHRLAEEAFELAPHDALGASFVLHAFIERC